MQKTMPNRYIGSLVDSGPFQNRGIVLGGQKLIRSVSGTKIKKSILRGQTYPPDAQDAFPGLCWCPGFNLNGAGRHNGQKKFALLGSLRRGIGRMALSIET